VTFSGFGSQTFTDYSAVPPDYTIWWQKDDPENGFNGGVFKRYWINPSGPGRHVLAARIKIKPTISNTTVLGYFVYLAPRAGWTSTSKVSARSADGLGLPPTRTTPGSPSTTPDGFLALAEFDKAAQGGDGDGVLDSRDAVFASLRLWGDGNHNGVSESGELRTLMELGLAELELNYKESRLTDRHGNQFRYRAKVRDVYGTQVGRWAWDVFLVAGP
jgi:hypothetical protein